jgi:hypothetical protein
MFDHAPFLGRDSERGIQTVAPGFFKLHLCTHTVFYEGASDVEAQLKVPDIHRTWKAMP